MKKTYINPQLEVIKINACNQLLAGSTLGMGTGDKDPITEADSREFFEDDDLSLFDE